MNYTCHYPNINNSGHIILPIYNSLVAPDDFFTFQLKRLQPAMLVMIYAGIAIVSLTAIWDWTSTSENKALAIYSRIPAAIAITMILIPVYIKPLQRFIVNFALLMGLISFCCLCINYILLPERTPYLPAILFYFMTSILVLAPVISRCKLVIGLFLPLLIVYLFLKRFDLYELYFFSFLMHIVPTHTFLLLTALQLKKNAEHNYILFCQSYELATHDPLTNLLNRAAWENQAKLELQRAIREHAPFAVVTADIDLFKRINDNFGHPLGDVVIKAVADCFKQHLRSYDLLARLGGEEYIIALPNVDRDKLVALCERMRKSIEALSIKTTSNDAVKVTISIGIAFLEDDIENLSSLMKNSDDALYDAKDKGRNRVERFTAF